MHRHHPGRQLGSAVVTVDHEQPDAPVNCYTTLATVDPRGSATLRHRPRLLPAEGDQRRKETGHRTLLLVTRHRREAKPTRVGCATAASNLTMLEGLGPRETNHRRNTTASDVRSTAATSSRPRPTLLRHADRV
jgi:hypothetical protein